MNLNDDQKFQVLIAGLAERYNAWHQMRARSTQFTLWILGLAIVVSWKLIQDPCSNIFQRVAATILVLALTLASIHFLRSIARGSKKNREALINVETALGTHTVGKYLPDHPVLPDEYTRTKSKIISHFFTLYTLLAVTSVYLIAAIWLPSSRRAVRRKIPAKHLPSITCISPHLSNINDENILYPPTKKGERQ